jgi:hypothetical protein
MTIVRQRPRPHGTGQVGDRVHIDTRLPGTSLARKVYSAPLDRLWQMPRAHRHNTSHHLLCLSGGSVIGTRAREGDPVDLTRLGAGESLFIAGRIAHQLLVEPGGVVASYFPPATWLSTNEDLVILDEDWFAR